MSVYYGADPTTGGLSICRAKPENRGKGRCHHQSHVSKAELDKDSITIQQYNEFLLSKTPPAPSLKKAASSKKNVVQGGTGGIALSEQEFHEASDTLADAFPKEDWNYITQFYQEFQERLDDEELREHFESSRDNIYSYLTSDSPIAKKTRDFLGPEIDLYDFSSILVSATKSMKRVRLENSASHPIQMRRTVLSQIHNDMSREKYVATVLFFAGRCCYCSCVMTKTPGPTQATGEHLTPNHSSQSHDIVGATRFGNMALACFACNNSRKNIPLKTWIKTADTLTPQQREKALKRIETFRGFAKYSEFSKEDSRLIEAKIEELSIFTKNFTRQKPSKKYSAEDFQAISDRFKSTVESIENSMKFSA